MNSEKEEKELEPLTIEVVNRFKGVERSKLIRTYLDWLKRQREQDKKEIKKIIIRKYLQRPEVKEKQREYQRKYEQRPEVKEKRREYQRKYEQRPEVKEKQREYQRKYEQRPEVKEKKREHQREYYIKKKRGTNNESVPICKSE